MEDWIGTAMASLSGAFGALKNFKDRLCIHSNGAFNKGLSAVDLVFCCEDCGFGCNGGYPSVAWDYRRWFKGRPKWMPVLSIFEVVRQFKCGTQNKEAHFVYRQHSYLPVHQ
ncbi:hypothetical protein X801_07419 [Opisthorchis viverrini]|uniref:Peptidase C1A papain C-terminal domain-containing protein n=1 Tax=Opisthorchis viverrini TaxID=6198 RepID=A0A1S8WQR7_OPIVI|nr:hypothetical protein X801_07419 [Opisthorchis viverrini]